MPLNPKILRRESRHVNNPKQVRLTCLHRNLDILRVVDERGFGDGFGASGVADGEELLVQLGDGFVVPVGEGENYGFIIEVLVRVFGVVDDEGPAKAVWVLAFVVGVVPVGAGLVDLERWGELVIAVRSVIYMTECSNIGRERHISVRLSFSGLALTLKLGKIDKSTKCFIKKEMHEARGNH